MNNKWTIITIIATKNRINFLNKAIKSVKEQTRKSDYIIVASDSKLKNYQIEKQLCIENKIILLRNKNSKNYGGNLNTAIDFVIKELVLKNNLNIDNILISFLDDDDTWNPKYLELCEKQFENEIDFIYSGLIFERDDITEKVPIFKELNEKTFLHTNPNIQGSNTFIKLKTILKAGGFDENFSATTDREFFTRVMMLKPKYNYLNNYLVNINAKNDYYRLTNSSIKKANSLKIFYNKYQSLMNSEDKKLFLKRASKFVNIELIKNNNEVKITNTKLIKNVEINENTKVLFAFVGSDKDLSLRLLKEIKNSNILYKKVLMIQNFKDDNFKKEMAKFDLDIELLKIDDINSILF